MTDAMILRTKSSQEFIQQYMYFYHCLFEFADVQKSSSIHLSIHNSHKYPHILSISPNLRMLGCLRGIKMKKDKDIKGILP